MLKRNNSENMCITQAIEKIWKCKCFRVIWLLIVPVVIGIILFNISIPLTWVEAENSTYFKIDEKNINHPGFQSTLRSIFSAPFDLVFYKVYIEDKSSVKDNKICEITWNFTINNQNFLLERGKILELEMIKIDEEQIWNKNAILTAYQVDKDCIFSVGFTADAKPYFWDVVAKVFLFLTAWLGFHFLFIEVNKLVKSGDLE